MNIGDTIRNFRLQRKMSLNMAEEKSGILAPNWSRIENGRSTPSLDTLSKISKAMGMELSELFAGEKGNGQKITKLTSGETAFLEQLRSYAKSMDGNDYKMALKKMKKAMTGA